MAIPGGCKVRGWAHGSRSGSRSEDAGAALWRPGVRVSMPREGDQQGSQTPSMQGPLPTPCHTLLLMPKPFPSITGCGQRGWFWSVSSRRLLGWGWRS